MYHTCTKQRRASIGKAGIGSLKTIIAMHAGIELKPKTLHSMITGLGLTHKDIEE